MKLKSSSAYEEMAKSGILILPSDRLLKSYTQAVNQHSGIVPEHLAQLRESASKLEGHQRSLILLFDEMKVMHWPKSFSALNHSAWLEGLTKKV